MIRTSLIFLALSFHLVTNAQLIITDIDVTGYGFCQSRSMVVQDETIYLQSSVLCFDAKQDSINCMAVSAHDFDGETIWYHTYEGKFQANENAISVLDNKLYVSTDGKIPEVNRTVVFLYEFSLDGELMRLDSFDLKDKIGQGKDVVVNGHVIVDNHCYIYGWTELVNDIDAGFIVKNELGSAEFESYFYTTPEATFAHHMRDLSPTADGNLRFLDNLSNVEELLDDRKKVTKINLNGEKISESLSPKYLSPSRILAEMTTLKNGNYVYINSSNSDDIFLHAPDINQVIMVNDNEEILWLYQYPLDPYSRGEITTTSLRESIDGGVIGSGFRSRRGPDAEGSQGTDAYLFKISGEGEMLWERFYKHPFDPVESYSSSILAFQELEDGRIVCIGGHSTVSKTSLIIVDKNGCLPDEDCGLSEFLATSSSENILAIDKTIKIYPNPSTGTLHIDIDARDRYQISLFSSDGILIDHIEGLKGFSKLNTDDYVSGLYFLIIEYATGERETRKISILND